MKRTSAFAIVLAIVLMATASSAGRKPSEDIQAPRNPQLEVPDDHPDEIQAPRGPEMQSPQS